MTSMVLFTDLLSHGAPNDIIYNLILNARVLHSIVRPDPYVHVYSNLFVFCVLLIPTFYLCIDLFLKFIGIGYRISDNILDV